MRLFSALQLPPSTKPFQEAQSELNQAAADLNQSAGEVVHATRGQSGELAAASGKFSEDFDEFLDAGIEMAGQAQVSVVAATSSGPLPVDSGRLSAPEACWANRHREPVSRSHHCVLFAAWKVL